MYYPKQRIVSELMRLQLRSLLPENTVGSVRVEQGGVVSVRDMIARGLVPARHFIIDAARELRLRKADELNDVMQVPLNTPIPKNTVIAGHDKEQGRRIFAPIDGLVVHVGEGRIIVQEMPEVIDLQAGVRGRVVQVHAGRGITIEATGGVVQGVWGNGRNVVAPIRMELDEGIENIKTDEFDNTYRGEILITQGILTQKGLAVAEASSFAGLIAPSMDASLLEAALEASFAIMLTVGFGNAEMNQHMLDILEQFVGRQGMLDAALPRRFDDRRPELMVHQLVTEEIARQEQIALEVGMEVQVTRDPYFGRRGQVVEIPNIPVPLANGLAVMVAQVEIGLETIAVPLENLELAGV
jgi:transcription antitermination factor NusG